MSPSGKAVDSGSTIPRVRILPPQPTKGADPFRGSAPATFVAGWRGLLALLIEYWGVAKW